MSRNPNVPYHFTLPPLPKRTYKLLGDICKKEGAGQWLAVIAGLEALRHLKHTHPEEVAQVWQAAREATTDAARQPE